MGFNPNICHLEIGHNPFTNHFSIFLGHPSNPFNLNQISSLHKDPFVYVLRSGISPIQSYDMGMG